MRHGSTLALGRARARQVLLSLVLILATLGWPPPAVTAPAAHPHSPVLLGDDGVTPDIALRPQPTPPLVAAAALAIQPEIQALAAGLDNDPLLLYEYVLNNFDAVPIRGLLKNPRETALSKQGNPYDLAALLSDLLRTAGYETEYGLGIIRIPVAQGLNWVGAGTPDVLVRMLNSGGIYSEVSGDVLRFRHIWVRAKIGGTWVSLDPSMKAYTYTQSMDLGAILGYDRDAYMAAALSGATVTGDYLEDLNTANIDARLTQYATNLAQYLRNNAPFASLAHVVGGRRIVQQTVSALPSQLPYTVEGEPDTFTDLPEGLQYRLNVQLPGMDYWNSIPALAGERITISYVGATETDRVAIAAAGGIYKVYPAYQIQMVPELRIGGVLVATGSPVTLGTQQPVTATVSVPWSTAGVPVVWQFSPRRLTAGAFYAIPMSLETVSEEALRRHYVLLEEYRAAGLAEDSEPVRGQNLHVLGLSYFHEVQASQAIDAALARVVVTPLIHAMFASQGLMVTEWAEVQGAPQPARVGPSSYGVDMVLGRNAMNSATGNMEQLRALVTHLEYKASAAEHAIIEQLQGTQAISAVRALDVANSRGQRIYRLTSDTVEALLPGLNYLDPVKDELRRWVQSGYVVIVPQGVLQYNQWRGTGWLVYAPDSGDLGGILYGWVTAGQGQSATDPASMGGSGTIIIEIDLDTLLWLLGLGPYVGTGCNQGCNDPDPNSPNNAGTDPVDTTTGAFLHQTTDLSFGSLGYPIDFVRTYNSASHNAHGPLGYGWTHSYAMRLATSSDWARGLGFRTAMDAVAAIAEAYVGLDLAMAPAGGLSLTRLVVGSESAHWSTSQVTHNVVTVTGPDGSHHQYLRLPDETYQPGHGDYTTLIANGDGAYTVTDKAGGRTEFDAQGRATALVDANGNSTSLSYDGQGQLLRVTDAAGRAIDLTYADGLLTQIVDPAGRTFRYSYDASGNLSTYTDPLGSVTRYAYDAERRLIALTDPEGIPFTRNEYDAFGRVTRQTDGRGAALTIRYGDTRSVATDALGDRTLYYYDRQERLVGMADHYGNRTYAIYDANDNILRTTDRLGHTATYSYDARGNLTRLTDALGNHYAFGYDAQDNLVALTDRLGAITRLEYDGHRNLIGVTDPLSQTTAHAYDGKGQRTSTTDGNGHTNLSSYDAQGNRTRVTDALGDATTMTYDNVGRLLTLADASGHTVRYTYDAADRLLRLTDPLGGVCTFTYDRNGLPLSATDALSHTTRNRYDAQFNLTAVTDTLGSVTRYAYDLNGRLTEITDANAHTTRYTRDALGRIVQATDALNRAVSVAYDADGQQVALTKADGGIIRYEYDAAGHITRTAYPDGSAATYVYDADGQVTRSSLGGWQAQYTYDAAGRLTRTDLAAESLSLAYRYDPAGNRLGIDVRRGAELLYDAHYAYDAADRMTSATDALAGYAVNYSYNVDNTVSAVRHSSGARASYAYDAAHRITQLDHFAAGERSLSSTAYTYDAVGNLLRAVQTTPGGAITTQYAYDALDRLLREQHARYALEYTYDAVGNRMRETSPRGTVTYSYDAADQLLSAGPATFAYDANGNQVRRSDARGTYAFDYDAGNHVAQIIAPGDVRTAFAYDAAGQRVAVQNSAGTVQTVYDGERAILEGVAGFGQGQAYLWGEATVAAGRTLGDQATALAVGYLGDRLGNVTAVTDAAGAPRGACVYDGFGRLQASTRGATGTLRFQGLLGVRAETAPSDLYWMGYRTFDATTGRFLTTDPLPGELVQPQSLHRYAYALNNPLRYVDPLGLRPEDQLLAFGPAVGGIQNTDSPFREPPDFQPLSDMSELRDILENLLRELQAEGLDVARSSGGGQSQPSFILTISEKYGWAQGQRNVRDANKAASTNKTQPDQAQQLIDILNNMLPQGS